MDIFEIVVGALLLGLGRRIFWLFVAAVGFFAGLQVATQTLNIHTGWVDLAIALSVGLIGALLAYFFQKAVLGLAGFLAGALIAWRLWTLLSQQTGSVEWAVILVGGILGIVLMYAIFEWALVVLSSLAGALLIVEGFHLGGAAAAIIGLALFVIGVAYQGRLNRHGASSRYRLRI